MKSLGLLIFALFGLFYNCNGQNEIRKDSLRSQYSQYYLTDLDLREVAHLILSDSIRPMDNDVTFNILDSISHFSKETRDFYYPAFQNILTKSDGALSEVMGIYSLKYIENYPNEFFTRYLKCNTQKCQSEFNSIVGFVQYEFEMSNSPKEDFNILMKKLNSCILDKELNRITQLFLNFIEDEL